MPELADVVIFESDETGLSNDRTVHRVVDETGSGTSRKVIRTATSIKKSGVSGR